MRPKRTQGALAFLADANVLIALLHARHALSGRAVAWLDTQGRCADTDYYLAAFARAGGYSLLTFDRGLRRIAGIALLVLD